MYLGILFNNLTNHTYEKIDTISLCVIFCKINVDSFLACCSRGQNICNIVSRKGPLNSYRMKIGSRRLAQFYWILGWAMWNQMAQLYTRKKKRNINRSSHQYQDRVLKAPGYTFFSIVFYCIFKKIMYRRAKTWSQKITT